MHDMSEKAALTTGPPGLTYHASLAKAESLGRLQHTASGPLAISDGDLNIFGDVPGGPASAGKDHRCSDLGRL